MAAPAALGRRLTRHGYGPLALALVGIVLAVLSVLRSLPATAPNPGTTTADVSTYLLSAPTPAPSIELTDAQGEPFTLASLRGRDVMVFFGYTHCPDVCPATLGIVGEAIRASAAGVRALFVSVDPARDTVAWLAQYSAYLPSGVAALTGSPGEVQATAGAWGVRYARVDGADPSVYTISHTADVWLVDRNGQLRARFPFGTDSPAMVATIATVDRSTTAASTAPSAATSPAGPASPSSGAPLALAAELVSTSIWSGPATPAILRLSIGGRPVGDPATTVTVAVATFDGRRLGDAVPARAVRPPGMDVTSWVASVTFPQPGAWRLVVTAAPGAVPLTMSVAVTALDPGETPALGGPAPTFHSPTVADADGDIRAVTTDPAPDPRLSSTSTTDALAAHRPFVLVADSTKFRVTSACGKAIVLARYLVDRWPDVAFIHVEPYRYSIVTDTPVLAGSLADPPLTEVATAWGIGGAPWGALSMPWVFVVDGNGVVRAKAQGVIGSDDVDVILALLDVGG